MSWCKEVVKRFPVEPDSYILVLDPDRVLDNLHIVDKLNNLGFTIENMNDIISLRFLFETKFCNRKDKLIIRTIKESFNEFPYDILLKGYKISLRLDSFFPKLSYPVLKGVDPDMLDRIYESYIEDDSKALGDKGTKEFILRNVYGIVPNLVKNEMDFLKILFSIHYKRLVLSSQLLEYLEDKWKSRDFFKKYNGLELLKNRDSFLKFLQQQWKCYVQGLVKGQNLPQFPFEHQDVRVYIDTLFLEGMLNPVPVSGQISDIPQWAKVGVAIHEKDKKQELDKLREEVDKSISKEDLIYKDWLYIARVFAGYLYLFAQMARDLCREEKEEKEKLHEQVEQRFACWLLKHYGTLNNLSYIKSPVMVNHIPHYINYVMKRNELEKIALIVMDGLALYQALVIKEFINNSGYNSEDMACFAWIPTMTSISRQAIFSGEFPLYFKDSLFTTAKEEKLWKRFWLNHGLKSYEIAYIKLSGNKGEDITTVMDVNPKCKVLGIVIGLLDDIAHGQKLGATGMYQDVKLWMEEGYLLELLRKLFNEGYEIFIASDHGNVSAVGQGRLNQGVLANTRGERVRIYQSREFAEDASKNLRSIIWPGYGLPDDISVLIAESRTAYIAEGENIVSHGGITIEEVIVPFIRVRKDE